MIVFAAAAACDAPNVSAHVMRASAPQTPLIAEQNGISGTVQVVISLDAESRVTAARILSSPSAVLNQPALAAARRSTYQTEVVGCTPIAADYVFSVDFLRADRLTTTASGAPAVEVTAVGTASRMSDIAYVYAVVPAPIEPGADATVSALLTALRAAGIPEADVSISSRFGPTAPRAVSVTVATIDAVPQVAAAIGAIQGVRLQSIGLGLRDRAPAFDEAVAAAVRDARARAQALAASNFRRLGEQVSVERDRTEFAASPGTNFSLRAPGAGPLVIPPLRPAAVNVRAIATVTYLLVP